MLGLLRRNSAFRRVFAAQIVSYLGDWFANVALEEAGGQTDRPLRGRGPDRP